MHVNTLFGILHYGVHVNVLASCAAVSARTLHFCIPLGVNALCALMHLKPEVFMGPTEVCDLEHIGSHVKKAKVQSVWGSLAYCEDT